MLITLINMNFFFYFLHQLFSRIITIIFQSSDFKFVECCAVMDSKEIWCPKKISIKKIVNDDDLVISSTRVVMVVNERGKKLYITLRDIMEIMYKHSFNLQYKKQSNDSKN